MEEIGENIIYEDLGLKYRFDARKWFISNGSTCCTFAEFTIR